MSIALEDISDCFEGVIPSIIATLDADGTPNVSYLSHVYRVDADHVALSNQFLSKTARNVQATGRATVVVVDGRTGDQYELDLRFEGSATSGEPFARMADHIQVAGAAHGEGIAWGLRSADLYRVLSCRAIPTPPGVAPSVQAARPAPLPAAARLAADLAGETDPDAMIDRVLDGLVERFAIPNAMILLADEDGRRLTTLASRGYPLTGVGSEAPFGEGAIGVAAATARPVRLSDMSRGRRFAAAVHAGAEVDVRDIPLPGLAEPQSQLAAPLISQGAVRGVLFMESEERFLFGQEHEDALSLLAAQLAACLRLWELEAGAARRPEPAAPAGGPVFKVRYYAYDDSLFIDDAYVIKGVPGRLLYYFLSAYAETGRRDFTNREVRLDAALRLPDLKDNLEARLILLRRRLEEKDAPVRLSRPGRGHIRLELAGEPRLEVIDDRP